MHRAVLVLLIVIAPCGILRAQDAALAVAWNDPGKGTGLLGAFGSRAPWEVLHDPIRVGLDSVLTPAFSKLFVLSPAEHTVRVVDPLTWSVERSFSLKSTDDLVDIKVVSPQIAYVTRRNTPQLLRLDLSSGTVYDAVDLSVLADADGNPDQQTMVAHDSRLFIQLQRLNFDDPGTSPQPAVAVLDLASQRLIDVDPLRDGVQAIELVGTFPKMKMQVIGLTRKLFVSATGAFHDAGGIEAIDLDTLSTEGLAIREADDRTGADLGAFVMVGPDRGFLVYSTDLLLSSHLHQFSLANGVDSTELAVALNYFSPAIEFDPATNSVFFPLGGSLDNGLHVFDATTGARLSDRLIPTSGSPTDLALVAPIPEPSGLLLVAMATLVGAVVRRRSRNQRQ